MRLTDAELAAMPAKNLRDKATLDLYRRHDFLDAYAQHTARRIASSGYQHAVGAGDNWETHGNLQRDFLISQGLQPEHRLLEIGCGTGRLARKAAPYLNAGGYVGVDIAPAAIRCAESLAAGEGWLDRAPRFACGDIPDWGPFDFLWAFAVFIHVPQEIMDGTLNRAASVMHAGSRFYWSYIPGPTTMRAGVKTFRRTRGDYQKSAERAGLTFQDIPFWTERAGHPEARWTGYQRLAVSVLA